MKFLFPSVEDDNNQANLTKNFNKNFLQKSLVNNATNITTPLIATNNTTITTIPLINKTILPDKIEEINEQYLSNSLIIDKKEADYDQNYNKSFNMEEDITLMESINNGAPMLQKHLITPQTINHKLPGLSLSIANNTNMENPYFNSHGMGVSLNNVGDEDIQQFISSDNNQTNSRNKLVKPLIPSLRLGNKGNDNLNKEGILKINFDLQHKELNEQKNIPGR